MAETSDKTPAHRGLWAENKIISNSNNGAQGHDRANDFNGRDIAGSGSNDIKPTHSEKVQEYIKRLKAGEKSPPIEVVDIPSKGRHIIEGHHRYVASQQSGIPVEIIVVEGSGPVSVPYSKESILMNPNFGRIRRGT